MRPFAYEHPATVDEALSTLQQAQADQIRLLAGGTDLLTLMKADIVSPSRLLDIKRLPDLPATIEATDSGLSLGALATLADIEADPLVQRDYQVLGEAAALAATPQLRNMATIGGNLLQRPRCWYFRDARFHCWLKGGDECQARDGENQLHAIFGGSPCVAVHPSDLASALVALDALIHVRGPQGDRALPIARFFALPDEDHRAETILAPDELVVRIEVPALEAGTRSKYVKAMDRKIWAFALVGVAVRLRLDSKGQVETCRVVLSGVAPIPWRVETAEEALLGHTLSPEHIERAAEAAISGAHPLERNSYKVPLARGLVRQALARLYQE